MVWASNPPSELNENAKELELVLNLLFLDLANLYKKTRRVINSRRVPPRRIRGGV